MPTLEENVNRVKAAKTAIGNAITAKGGTVGANDGLEDFASDIATIPSGGGGGSQSRKDVNFYDYDGTIVNSYTATEFAELSELPVNPYHEGLTAQGWNWSLADAKTYVLANNELEIGQMYVTSDGKTRIYIELSEGRTSPVLQLYLNDNSELDIDWGDGSTHSTFTSTSAGYVNERHNYASPRNYIIAINVISGSFAFKSSSTNAITSILWNSNDSTSSPDQEYNNSIIKVEIGTGISEIGSSAFRNCRSLSSITLPDTITAITKEYAFGTTIALSYITIPSSVNYIDEYVFAGSHIKTIALPKSINSIKERAFYGSLIKEITIPDSSWTIEQYAFYGCNLLTVIKIPASVTSIGNNAFTGCSSLATITIDKAEGSISGSPWGATTGSPTNTQIIWTGE